MFSPETISRITEQLRQSQEQVASDEKQLAASRASLDEWSTLLAHVEAHAAPQAPAARDVLVATPRGNGWCFCGLPGVPEVVHNFTECRVLSASDLAPSGSNPYPEQRAPFEPYVPASAEQADQSGTR